MEERIAQHNAQIAQQKLELEERLAQQKLGMEKDLRLREVELKEVQAKQDLEMKGQKLQMQAKKKFKASEATTLLPPFDERDVGGYFCSFESLARVNEWPEGQWLTILFPKLTGKAQRVFNTLEQFDDYAFVKDNIIKAYEITPKAYRQKFRSLTKSFSQTFVEFATKKMRLLKKNGWIPQTLPLSNRWSI